MRSKPSCEACDYEDCPRKKLLPGEKPHLTRPCEHFFPKADVQAVVNQGWLPDRSTGDTGSQYNQNCQQ